MNAAIVTLAYGNPIYYRLAAVWGLSLQRTGTTSDHFVMVPKDVRPDLLKPLIQARVAYRHVWPALWEPDKRMTKYNVLSYTEYDRIFYTDVDYWFRKNPDEVVSHRDYRIGCNLFVIAPSKAMFEPMKNSEPIKSGESPWKNFKRVDLTTVCQCTNFKPSKLKKWRKDPGNAEYMEFARKVGFGDIAGDKPKRKKGRYG